MKHVVYIDVQLDDYIFYWDISPTTLKFERISCRSCKNEYRI